MTILFGRAELEPSPVRDVKTIPEEGRFTDEQRRSVLLALLAAVSVGFAIRTFHVLSANFPLNDGGLFMAMVEDLRRSGYALPAATSYNAARIPYAYPPLVFYMTAFLSDLAHISVLDLLRYLPLVASVAALAAFVLLARALIASPTALTGAVFAFALLPRSFIWNLMGGGLTRSFGFLFAVLALHQAYLMYTTRAWSRVVMTTVFCALTVLSHLGTAPFLAYSIALFFVFWGRHREGVIGSVLVGTGVALLTAPWWGTVMATHGLTPVLAAYSSGGSIVSDVETRRALMSLLARLGVGSWNFTSTGEPLFPIIGTLALLGAVSTLRQRRPLFAVWWLMTLVLDSRAGATYAALPVALLAGHGFADVLLPLLRRVPLAQATVTRRLNGLKAGQGGLSTGGWLLLAFLVCYAIGGSLLKHPGVSSDIRFLVSLAPEEREAMRWVAQHTPAGSHFLVLPENEWNEWYSDKISEWFPLLADRVSIATVQGTEWLPGKEFDRRTKSAKELRRCGSGGLSCVDRWVMKNNIQRFTHVYIPLPTVSENDRYLLCCLTLIGQMKTDPQYSLLYDGPGGVVFARSGEVDHR